MTEFLVAAAIGVILSGRRRAFIWPVVGLMVMIAALAASAWTFETSIWASLLALAGFNAGLLAGVGIQMALHRTSVSASKTFGKSVSGFELPR